MDEGVEVNSDAKSGIPQLYKANFLHRHFSNAPYDRLPVPLVPQYLGPYSGSCKEPDAKISFAG